MTEVEWSDWQLSVIDRFRGKTFSDVLREIPPEYKRYKCHTCMRIVDEDPCPNCGSPDNMLPMCPLDHAHCSHEVVETIAYCPICKEAICPICGSHDVVQISRVTGYLQEVNGWNIGKQQELKDRKRYLIT